MHNWLEKDNPFILNENKWKQKYKLETCYIVGNNKMTDIYQYIQKVFEITSIV